MKTFVALVSISWTASAFAEVTRVEILERAPFADSRSFGPAGPYERIRGRLVVEVDPDHPANARIHDLKLAPRNARGKVECRSDFFLLKPQDARRGNGRILYDVNNRGNMLALWTFNAAPRSNDPRTAADAGNGFLLRHGYSLLWCGWSPEVQDDGTHRLLTEVPLATDGGRDITGPAHLEFLTAEKVFSRPFGWSPWAVSAGFPAVSLDTRQASLTMVPRRGEPPVELPHDAWAFARRDDGRLIPDPTHLYVKDGFQPGWLYDLVYTARQPRVSGLGLAALRDCVSFFRYAEQDAAGTPNPLAAAIDRAYLFGISQSGRLGHHFVSEGFNTDEARRPVFDGVLAHVAGAGRGLFTARFRLATEAAGQHEMHLCGSERFPFSPAPQTDPLTAEEGGTLERARTAGHVPRMMFVQTSTEYWSRAASLLHTDVEGQTDLDLPDEIRIYLVAGAQHLGGGEPTHGICQQPRNILDDRGPVLRALLVALDRWVSDGVEPPPSRHPRLADGTLVDVPTFRAQFPRIPGVNLPENCYEPPRLDFGPRLDSQGIVDHVPPKAGPPYRTLVPAVDADGNETAGIVLPDVAVPLGTFAGWNLRAAEFGAEGMLSYLDGMHLPFALTLQERRSRRDPRPSVRERYPTRADYLARITDAALQLQQDGLLLPEDVIAILAAAAQRELWD